MSTVDVKDASGATVAIEKPLTPGRAAATASRPVALSTEDKAVLDNILTALGAGGLAQYVDGLEALVTAGNSTLTSLQTLLNTQAGYVDGLEGLIGTSNTSLTALQTLLTTQAGYLDGVEGLLGTGNTSLASILSKVSSGYTSSVTITRPSDALAYLANDIVGNLSSPDQTGAIQFTGIGPSGGGDVLITSARLQIHDTALISGETSYNLYLYSVTPPSALPDNSPFDIPSGDRTSYLGKISLGTPVDEGSTLSIDTDVINKQVTVPSGGALFGYLVTVGAYTPTSGRVVKIILKAAALG